jgi:two-component system response regulator NreC
VDDRAGTDQHEIESARELVDAVRTVVGGETYINPQLGARLAAEPDKPEGPPDDLTPREVEVLRLLAQRRTDREIADELFISPKTAGFHVANILGKLGVANRREAAALALREGLTANPS